MNNHMEFDISSGMEKVKGAISTILGFFQDNLPDISDQDLFDLKLIFSELVCNAVIHGNKEDISKTVHICIEISQDEIFASVTDQGPGFDYIKLQSEFYCDDSLYKENGRGIMLVLSLTDSIDFIMNGRKIQFHKRVSRNAENSCC